MKPTESDLVRHVPVEGVYNLRHLGGYATADGRTTLPGRVYRSDSLHQLTPDAQKSFLSLGIRSIIDLRSPAEAVENPSVFNGSGAINYYHMPLYDDWQELGYENGGPRDQRDHYEHILVNCHHTLGAVLAEAAKPDALPILVHCQVGKDRTGLVAALLLALAGVSVDSIVQDYALSAGYLQPLLFNLRQKWRQEGHDMSHMERFLYSPPADMYNVFDFLEESYGGVESYLRVLGLTEDQMRRLRLQMVE